MSELSGGASEYPRKTGFELRRAGKCGIVEEREERLRRRILARGDADLIRRALFLKEKLEAMPENRGHLYDNTGKTTEDMLREIVPEDCRVEVDG